MPSENNLLTAEDLRRYGGLQVFARQVVEGFFSGLHQSPHKGFSVEFKEHRAYVVGDDIRSIDWKLFGKTDRLYIREYEQETNLRCTILLDASGSMAYRGTRSGGLSKHDYAVRVAASLSYLMLQQQDSVGLVTFDTHVRKFIPPRAVARHLIAVTDALEKSSPGGETELGRVFHEMAAKVPRRGMLIVLSDLFADVDQLMKAIAHFRQNQHEIVIFQIWDPDELDFPFERWTQFVSLEEAGKQHLADPAQIREAYLAKLEEFREKIKRGCSRQRVSLVPMSTNQPYADAIAAHLALRRRSG